MTPKSRYELNHGFHKPLHPYFNCILALSINNLGNPHPVEDGQHHVQLLLLLLLGHVSGRMAEFGEEAAQVHQAQRVVLGTAFLLPWPAHDPLHHVHLERLRQAKASPGNWRELYSDIIHLLVFGLAV